MRYLKTYESYINLGKNKFPPTVDELIEDKDGFEKLKEEQDKRRIEDEEDKEEDGLINGHLPTFPHTKMSSSENQQ